MKMSINYHSLVKSALPSKIYLLQPEITFRVHSTFDLADESALKPLYPLVSTHCRKDLLSYLSNQEDFFLSS